ncbi:disulfide bond formation protein B [Larsenimonas rhizosphaerae]|uniref:Disulfide bond formation protein B n=1 Tax=Larsenimonas rhizosphaerae TaxID=2944682 RepID=A0AA41ZGE3_9GAMM|nr:disulfide bond formation protein B [Larsenimonas rhizosphaerae]MCM2131895.1 disulfide bond formation protein B [Larsenimonas rhizosphaerae]MCX2524799.1 disulfide bond formation protein B [Larsenimonas rhizosphaerae]
MSSPIKAGTTRRECGLGAVFCALMLGAALIMQHGFGLDPCPLCIFQRVAVLVALIILCIGALHNPKGRGGAVYGGLALVSALVGAGIAGRHAWLQTLPPDQVPTCGPGLDYMMEVLPFWNVISQVLSGSGECAEVSFRWLGMTLPVWTLIGFTVLAVITLGIMVRSLRRAS